jgi:hypothetical protein
VRGLPDTGMLSAVRSTLLTGAALAAAALLAGACTSTTTGHGTAGAVSPPRTTPTHDFPSTTPVATTPATSPVAPTTASSQPSTSGTVHPAPATPVRTATVHAADGTTYHVQIWWDVQNDTCFDHAYGQPMITFLTTHPCSGLRRILATTTVNGRPVGFAMSATGFPGTRHNLYGEAGQFARLEEANGTGSLNDLLREGYRLPSGPTSVPSSEAFNVLGQDTGVTVWDAWYLDGPTPTNDPALIKMTQDLFLQF